MKRIIFTILVFSLFLSGCSYKTDISTPQVEKQENDSDWQIYHNEKCGFKINNTCFGWNDFKECPTEDSDNLCKCFDPGLHEVNNDILVCQRCRGGIICKNKNLPDNWLSYNNLKEGYSFSYPNYLTLNYQENIGVTLYDDKNNYLIWECGYIRHEEDENKKTLKQAAEFYAKDVLGFENAENLAFEDVRDSETSQLLGYFSKWRINAQGENYISYRTDFEKNVDMSFGAIGKRVTGLCSDEKNIEEDIYYKIIKSFKFIY